MIAKERQIQAATKLFQARELLTALTLIISLFITYRIWDNSSRNAEQAMASAFKSRAMEMRDRIQQRLTVYEQVLRASVATFNVAPNLSRAEFQDYVTELKVEQNYPGIQALGLAKRVFPEELEKHEQAVRAEGYPNYSVQPAGKRDVYGPILLIEPFSGRNLRAFGFDMYSEPARRAAMETAQDSGEITPTNRVQLIQENGVNEQAGFLMYAPVYHREKPHTTMLERRANLIGWVYAAFRAEDFIRGIQLDTTSDFDKLDIEIYTGTELKPDMRLVDTIADSPPGHHAWYSRLDTLTVGSQKWTLLISAMPQLDSGAQAEHPILVLQAGISISLLVALLVWLFLDDRARALQAAHQAMELALYDALTGLPNRKLLDERLNQAIASAKRTGHRLALLFIDLDKFKPVNDNYGHAYGDLLLKEVGRRLYACMRESDTAARLGGDEFVALLVDVEDERAVALVGEKILAQLNLPYELAGHVFHISASIGGALYPAHGADVKSLMKAADLAMYAAKNAGRSNVKLAHGAEVT
ncbi:CHASE domain-containing protein [Noviherbaspirillum galbum]|uniref:Diguanylate cyclase n=1 Tax=Noviherbaspirillum galbum TaxID=2709383 RepID=A0A6B3STS8_9BURK|nr:CHASE domain-containing protein [Noviherbaspirillum galbum]NEX64084.1 diguanylate cyclase [Noviherbaspirillum galbum]